MYKFKVGDLVNLDLDAILRYNKNTFISDNTPQWYTDESFTVIDTSYTSLISFIYLDRNILHSGDDNRIPSEFLKLDLKGLRMEKLKQLYEYKNK